MPSTYRLPALLLALVLFAGGCGGKNPLAVYPHDLGNGICRVPGSGLLWQTGESNTVATFAEAQAYAKKLAIGGYTDWRLPTRQELYDLAYELDLHPNGECDLDREGNYWSKESDEEEGEAGAWEISANQCDPARQYARGRQGRVRAVRP